MKKVLIYIIMCTSLLNACSYDEEIEVCDVYVTLIYPNGSVGPYAGSRVELKDIAASVYVDSTNAQGVSHFRVPSGIYEASTSSQFIDSTNVTWWRYNFNGVKSMIIVSRDSTNRVDISLRMSKKRIVR